MATVIETIKAIQEAPADENLRITRRIEIGHCVQQGDIYLFRVPDSHPRGKQIGKGSVQIALGTGNGARHMAEGDVEVFEGTQLPDGVTSPEGVEPMELCGPRIVAAKTWRVPHPEHPHHQLPAGHYQTVYQFDPRTMRRVAD